MPIVAPMMKVEACRQYGANVVVFGRDFGEVKLVDDFSMSQIVHGII